MLRRCVTGLVGAAGLLVLLYARGWVLEIALAMVALLCCAEVINAFRTAGVSVAVAPVFGMAVLMLPAYHFMSYTGLYLVTVLSALLIVLCAVFRKEPKWVDIAASFSIPATMLVPLALFFPLIRIPPDPLGALMTLLVFVIAYFGDTFAYFCGVLIGKTKLAPNVSPKKTREGAVAGLLGSMGGAALLFYAGSALVELPPVWHFALLGLVGGFAGQLGDLCASMAKRFCGVKDFGTLFPGHGGMLDRIDSVLFVSYVVFGYCLMTGML